ncbi:MAG: prolyl oligopeptidase family serine peptidase [Pseudomonadota bacterium]
MPRLSLLLAAALLVALLPLPAVACGAQTDCAVEGGVYRLVMPEAEAPVPALFFLHGWGASPEGTLRGRADLRVTLSARGYALILPEGIPRAGRTQRDWAVRDDGRHPRDDLAFFDAVLQDAASRGVDRERVLLGGFSRGGSMVWYVACERPDLFAAYAPVAGAFWYPIPTGCTAPGEEGLALFHTHGWDDRVVPLEGRLIGGGRLTQGDAFESLAILRRTLGCTARLPDEAWTDGPRWRRDWTSCSAGRISLSLHPGGHIVPAGWTSRMLDWFETAPEAAPSR